ncbi:MAG TPA: HAD family hydrolase [Conexivisphaerales archaeon]|nr:HAD family hydrolase [Conexivisphaerales archaeon]
MQVRAALFDLDGTLVEFRVDYNLGRRMIIEYARGKGYDMEGQTETRNMHDIIEHYARIGDEKAHADVKKYAYDLMERLELEGAATTKPFPDTLPTLETLRGAGLKMGIVTNSARKPVELVMKRYPLGRFFDVVTTRDDVTVIKPDPGIVQHTIDTLGVASNECFLVGDAPGDMMAAKSLRIVAVGIPRGSATREALIEAGPDYVIDTLRSLPELIVDLKAH